MTSIGETLRRERLRLGLDLDAVAQRTKIGTRLLKAIEADEFDKLPGGVFTRSFVKQYAGVLGLDQESIGAEIKALMQGRDESPPLPQGNGAQPGIVTAAPHAARQEIGSRLFDLDIDTGSRSTLISVGWAAGAIAVCIFAYLFLNHSQSPGAVSPADRAIEQPAVALKKAAEPPQFEPPRFEPPPAVSAPAALAASEASAPSATPTAVQVVLNASEDCWMSITADGKTAFAGIL
ncbi:MAG: helix-turn-helix domain-containing protein, partial [Acidobacteriota bacterium]|nr:helix-turn-helix domain-containing protein [Acidobacteriota bacterium]